ncbi:MAG: Bcr/CflA family efflux MFS transporter [Alphaproteobacteria bacterium]|nr:Bcr/CflA family efflux MFS transporter [Alphaproteobacteria bacterium]
MRLIPHVRRLFPCSLDWQAINSSMERQPVSTLGSSDSLWHDDIATWTELTADYHWGHGGQSIMVKLPPVILLVGLAASGAISLNIFVPSIPGLVTYFHTDLATVQLVMSMYLVAVAVGQLVYGPLSDRFGRRPIVLIGLYIYVVGSVSCALAPTIEALIMARMVQALGASCGLVLCRAIIGDVYGRERAASVLGYVTTAMAVAPAMSPALGGFLDRHFSWRASVALVVAFGICVLLLAIARAHETRQARGTSTDWLALARGYQGLLASRRFLGYAINSGTVTSSYTAFLTGAAVLMIDVLGYSVDETGLYLISVSVSYMLGNFIAGRFSIAIGLDRMVHIGTAMALAGAVAFGFSAWLGHFTPVVLFAAMSVISIGNGISQPNAMAGALSADSRYAGSAAGLTGFLQMSFSAISTLAVGHFLRDSAVPLSVIMSIALTVGLTATALTKTRPAKVS